MNGAAAQDLTEQLAGRWPRVLDRVDEPVRGIGEPLLVVPASEGGSGLGGVTCWWVTPTQARPVS